MPGVSKNLDNVCERFDNTVRGFVENLRARRSPDRLQRCPPLATLRRKKSAEAERIRGQTARHQRRQKRRRARNRHHRHMMADGQRNQAEPRVRNSRHARIGHQRDACSLLHFLDEFGRARHLIVFVVTDGASRNAVVVEQLLRPACVFARDKIRFLENAQSAQRDVLQVADGRGDEIKRRTRREGRGRASWLGGLAIFVASILHGGSLPPQRP